MSNHKNTHTTPNMKKSETQAAPAQAASSVEETVTEKPLDVASEVVESTTTALAPAEASEALAAPAETASYDARIEAIGDSLRELALRAPDLADNLENLAMYAVANIEGIAGGRTVSIPNLMVRQAMTKAENFPEKCKVGEFYTKQGDCLGNSIEIIVLFSHNKRVKFIQGKDQPECSSEDGVTGNKYGVCKTCPYAKFEEGAKAACSSGHSFGVVLPDFSQMFLLDMMKTSAKTGKRLKGLAAPPAIFSSVFKIYTEKEKNTQGEYYVIKVAPTGVRVLPDKLNQRTIAKGEPSTELKFLAAQALSRLLNTRHDMFVERNLQRLSAKKPDALPAGTAGADMQPDENPTFEGSV